MSKLKVDEIYSSNGTITLTGGTKLSLENSRSSIRVPVGTTAQQSTPNHPAVRYNQTTKSLGLHTLYNWSRPPEGLEYKRATSLIPAHENVVTDSLVLMLDSGLRNSYPGYGSTWFDISGSGNHAQIQNSPSYNIPNNSFGSEDWNGGYWSMNYSNNRMIVPSLEYFRWDAGLTVGFWWYNGGGTGYYRGIVTNGINSDRQGSFDWRIGREDYYGGSNNGTMLNFHVETSGGEIRPNILATVGEWHYYCGTFDNRTVRLYKDGILWSAHPHPSPGPIEVFGGDGNGVIIGHSPNTSEYMDGRFGACEIYSRALTDAEVLQNYEARYYRWHRSYPPDINPRVNSTESLAGAN